MAERRGGYGNDVMKVYEGGTVAAWRRRGCKRRYEQKFPYLRHRTHHHNFVPLYEDVLAFISFF